MSQNNNSGTKNQGDLSVNPNNSYSKIEIGDDVILDPSVSVYGYNTLQTTIIKPNGDVYKECCFCGRYFSNPRRIYLIRINPDL